jgi:CelD/BcsL family acetyltransferase involved in cellulose biosynthesis
MYKFEFITDWEIIWSDEFQTKWLSWLENSSEPNIFFHPEFAKVWINTYLPIRDLKPIFCIAKDEKENIVFLPLVLWSKDWKSAFEKVIVPVGYSDYDYNFPIVKGEFNSNFWEELLENLYINFKTDFNQIELSGIKENFHHDCKIENLIKDDICPIIEINKFSDFDDYLSNIKSKERSDIKRQERRLKELGKFEFKVYKEDEIKKGLDSLEHLIYHHSLRWPNAYKAPEYHKNLLENLLPKGLIHMSEILIDNKTISWNISFIYNGAYYFYMPTYVDEYRKYSPGKVNMFLCLKDCFEKNFKVFDMLKGAEDYKKKIPTKDVNVGKIIESNIKFSTKLKKVALNVKSKIK